MFRKVLLAMVLSICASLPAGAADYDGSTPIYCAFTKILECDGKKGCESVSAEEVFLPAFIRIEFQKNLISARKGEELLTTEIKNLQRRDGKLILQGMERRVWCLMIDEKTGKLTLAVAGEDDGFLVFGSCMAP